MSVVCEVKPRLLVIDRDSGLRTRLHLMLDGEYEIDQAYSGALGKSLLHRHQYDLIIASADMPSRSGYRGASIIRQIRGVPGYEHVPVVMLVPEEGAEQPVLPADAPRAARLVRPARHPLGAGALRAAIRHAHTRTAA